MGWLESYFYDRSLSGTDLNESGVKTNTDIFVTSAIVGLPELGQMGLPAKQIIVGSNPTLHSNLGII